jgi:myo-inositol-1(or 4)-monophosphatase
LEAKDQLLEVARDSARIGGEILLSGFRLLKKEQVRTKGAGDFVTEMDHRSEEAVIRRIRESYPDHEILAEESGAGPGRGGMRWIIDPLDGTTNYVHGVPFFCVSVAVERDGITEAGVVFDPVHRETFWAVRGGGAFLNGPAIHVSGKTVLSEGFFASGFPWRSKEYLDPYLASFKDLFETSSGIRRMGSAAIDLCYTACGRFDGFWEMKLKPWDIAAAALILTEAGGVVSDFRGGDRYMESGNVAAANPSLHPGLLAVVTRHLRGVE